MTSIETRCQHLTASDKMSTTAAMPSSFPLPVDSEHKALKINLFSVAIPHMRAFHLCWFGFFTSFVSVFAPAAMIPVVRESLGLTAPELGNAGARRYTSPRHSVALHRRTQLCSTVHNEPIEV